MSIHLNSYLQTTASDLKRSLSGKLMLLALLGAGFLPAISWAGNITFTQAPVIAPVGIGSWALDSTSPGYVPSTSSPDVAAHGDVVLGENLNVTSSIPVQEYVMQVATNQAVAIGGSDQSFFFSFDNTKPVSQITITPTGPLTYFNAVKFDPQIDPLPSNCTSLTCFFTLTATYFLLEDPFIEGTEISNPYAMFAGENMTAAVASFGYGISKLVVDMSPGMSQFEHFRIDYTSCTLNPAQCGPVDVPEPSSIVLLGIGLAALLAGRQGSKKLV